MCQTFGCVYWKWLCLSQSKASERCCVFILFRWCTATITLLPSHKQLWLTKQPLMCLSIHAGVATSPPLCSSHAGLQVHDPNPWLRVASPRRPSTFLCPPHNNTQPLRPSSRGGRSEHHCWKRGGWGVCLSCSACSVACWKVLNAPNLLEIIERLHFSPCVFAALVFRKMCSNSTPQKSRLSSR